MSDALSQIKKILSENEAGSSSEKINEAGEPLTRDTQTITGQPSSGGEVVLKGPGVEMISKLLDKISTATPPHKDSKGKSTSRAKNLTSLTTTTLGEDDQEENAEGEEIQETENDGSENSETEVTSEEIIAADNSEHLEALFNGENLSEDFKQKAAERVKNPEIMCTSGLKWKISNNFPT